MRTTDEGKKALDKQTDLVELVDGGRNGTDFVFGDTADFEDTVEDFPVVQLDETRWDEMRDEIHWSKE